MNAVATTLRTSSIGRRLPALMTAFVLAVAPFPAIGLRAQQAESLPATPAAVAAAISAATAAAIDASPGQAASITATSLAATSRAFGKDSPTTLSVAKQTVTAAVSKLETLNLQSEIPYAIRTAVAVTPWLQAEITRAAIDAAPSLRSEILKAAKLEAPELGARETAQPGQDLNQSIDEQINTIIDQINAQALTANPTTLTEGSPTPTPSPTASPSPTATPVSPHY